MTMQIEVSPNEKNENFVNYINEIQLQKKTSRDPRDKRISAILSALMETIQERKSAASSSPSNSSQMTPFDLYACSLTALEGTLLSLKEDANVGITSQLPLLKILQVCIPYIEDVTLMESQYHVFSRTLKHLIQFHDSTTLTETNDELGSANALLRQVISTATTSLTKPINESHKKQVFNGCLLRLFHNKRPRVRRTAQEAIMNLLGTNEMQSLSSIWFLEFAMHSLNSKDFIQLTHLMNFTQTLLSTLTHDKKVMEYMDEIMKTTMTLFAETDAEQFIHSSLTVLNEYLEYSQNIAFASRVIASLLQIANQYSISTNTSVYFVHCLVSSSVVLQNEDILEKLIPLVFELVVKLSTDAQHDIMIDCRRLIQSLRIQDEPLLKVCTTLYKFTAERFRPHWNIVLPNTIGFALQLYLVSSHEKTSKFCQDTLLELINMHDDVNDAPTKKAIETTISNIIQAIHIEPFCKLINNIPQWILPLLQKHGAASNQRLAFFQLHILNLARQCDAKTTDTSLSAMQQSLQKQKCVEYWALFPCFCHAPIDVADTLPTFIPTLNKAIQDVRYPALVNIICSGLVLLAKEAQVSQAATKILPTLFKLIETLSGAIPSTSSSSDQNEAQMEQVIQAIAELAKIAPKPFLQSLFKKVMAKFVQVLNKEETTELDLLKIYSLESLSLALVSSKALNHDCIAILYRAMKPMIRSDASTSKTQKKAYRVMAEMCLSYNEYFLSNPDRLQDILDLLMSSIITCHVAARYWRLKCICYLNLTDKQVVPQIIGEVILCLKDSNKKTRELAFRIVLDLAESQDTNQYFQMIVAGLAGQTPQMRSASVMALSRLVYELANDVEDLLPNLLETVMLLQQKPSVSKEEMKSVMGFIRVCLSVMKQNQLQPLLKELVPGIFEQKDRFRAKIKILLKKLIKRFGYDEIVKYMPKEDMRLLTHLRKLEERNKRRGANDNTTTARNFDAMMDSDEYDSDDGRTLQTGMTTRMTKKMDTTSVKSGGLASLKSGGASSIGATTQTGKSKKTSATAGSKKENKVLLRNEKDGEVFDMLQSNMAAKNIHYLREDDDYDSDFDDDDDLDDNDIIEFNDDGKLVIPDDLKAQKDHDDDEDDDDNEDRMENALIKAGGKRSRVSKFETVKEAKQRQQKQKQQPKQKGLGSSYKAKKASGDVKRKDQKFEPYAYVPLDAKNYSKKRRDNTVEQMSSIVRGRKTQSAKNAGKRKRR